MIARIIEWSLKNRFLVLIGALVLLLVGIYTLKNIPVDAIPDLSDVQVIVKTHYPGQAPQVVEDQVTYPIAAVMLSVPGSVAVRAYSFFGDSYIYIIFQDGTDLYWARSRVLEYLDQISGKLPSTAKPHLGPDATGVGWVYEYALVDETGKHDISELTTLQNWHLKYELETVQGVSEVATVGGMVKRYQVTLDPDRIRAYGITIDQVKKAIQRSNNEVGGSVVEMAEAEYMVTTNGYIQTINNLENVSLGATRDGTPILLSDVAQIDTGPDERRGVAELNGKGEVVGGIVVMRMGENALKTIDAVKAKIAELRNSLPPGIKIVETYDRSGLIKRAIDTLQHKLIEEIVIVILVCIVFLFHIRSSLIVVVSLPIGVLSAFIIMYWQGINANIMSLGGIAIAIGAMVDAAIVMIENVHKHIEVTPLTKENRWEIMRIATLEVGPPLFFSLLIITCSFLPVFALQAQEGRMFKPLAYTKTYSMAAAAGLAITLVPVLMGYFIRGKIQPEHKNPLNRFLIALYTPVIDFILKAPKTVLSMALLFIVVSYWPLAHLGSEFMPTLEEGDWMYMPSLLPGDSIGKARQILQQMDKMIKSFPEVKSVFGKVGRAQTATDPAPISMIETIVQFKPRSQWPKGMTPEKLKKKFEKIIQFPGVTSAWVMPIKARIDMLTTGIKTPVGIKIIGPSLQEIQNIGKKIEGVLKTVPGTASVYADRAVGGRYINIDFNRREAARFALNVQDIEDVVELAIGGMDIAETVQGRERFPINLRYPPMERDSLEKIKMLPIVSALGAHIPLADVAKVYIADGPPMIKTEDVQLTGWIYVDITTSNVGGYVKRAKAAIAKQVKLPPNYSLIWSGQYEYMQRAKERLMIVGPFALLIIFLLLYFNFGRFSEVFLILLTLPFALTGGIWLLYLLHYNLSVAVGVGFIALAGVSVEIGVLMLVYLNRTWNKACADAEAKHEALTQEHLKKVIVNGALMRIRPIAMTVTAIIAGLLPIMLGGGTGSEVMRRIAAPMVGGMISSTLLTLIVIPAVYFIWKSANIRGKN